MDADASFNVPALCWCKWEIFTFRSKIMCWTNLFYALCYYQAYRRWCPLGNVKSIVQNSFWFASWTKRAYGYDDCVMPVQWCQWCYWNDDTTGNASDHFLIQANFICLIHTSHHEHDWLHHWWFSENWTKEK